MERKKFDPRDYEIKGYTNPYKPDIASRPTEPTIPMSPKIHNITSNSNSTSGQQNQNQQPSQNLNNNKK